jgi:hypothetical protein
MSRANVFALKNNGVNLFLFADVGTENNGSMLTVLSVLARLGLDPWAQATQWMRLPKAEIIDRLASSIAQMPLPPQALRDARQTAARLIQLLPTQTSQPNQGSAAPLVPRTVPRWALAAAGAIMLALAIGGTLLSTSGTTNTAVVPLVQTDSLSPTVPSR